MRNVRKRIFMINQSDESQRYGVGKYISEMISETKKRKNGCQLVAVTIGVKGLCALQKKKEANIMYLDIPRPIEVSESTIKGLSRQYLLAVYCILSDLFDFSENDIFHFNNNMQHFLLKEIKENTTAKVIYTIHVSLWKVFFKNDKKLFLQKWREPEGKPDADHIFNIRAEKKDCLIVDSVICLTKDMAEDVSEFYEVPEHKVKVVPNGVNTGKDVDCQNQITVLPKKMVFRKDEVVFLFVGRLNLQKGVKELVKAFISVTSLLDGSFSLIVVGDGSLSKSIVEISKKSNARIYFTGYVEPEAIHKYYALADAMVFPSINEQSSYVMLEAMKYKVPMIVTDISAFDALNDGFSCIKSPLVRGKVEIESLAQNIKCMALNASLRQRIATKAYELFLEKYSSESMFLGTYGDFLYPKDRLSK